MKKNYRKNITGAIAFVIAAVLLTLAAVEGYQTAEMTLCLWLEVIIGTVATIVAIVYIPVFCLAWGILGAVSAIAFSEAPRLAIEQAIIWANMALMVASILVSWYQSKKENPSSRKA